MSTRRSSPVGAGGGASGPSRGMNSSLERRGEAAQPLLDRRGVVLRGDSLSSHVPLCLWRRKALRIRSEPHWFSWMCAPMVRRRSCPSISSPLSWEFAERAGRCPRPAPPCAARPRSCRDTRDGEPLAGRVHADRQVPVGADQRVPRVLDRLVPPRVVEGVAVGPLDLGGDQVGQGVRHPQVGLRRLVFVHGLR